MVTHTWGGAGLWRLNMVCSAQSHWSWGPPAAPLRVPGPYTWASYPAWPAATGTGLPELRDCHMPSSRPEGLAVRSCGLENLDFVILKSEREGRISEG